MKKGIRASLLGLMVVSCMAINTAYADDHEAKPIQLKSKCVKQNPLASGQTDQALLTIYQQVCDSDKKDVQGRQLLLMQAAMRMYELKQPLNALNLVQQLQQQGVKAASLTDIRFLASVAIADETLGNMRSNEMRYLSQELTYPPAKQLSDHIQIALPAPDTSHIKPVTDESLKAETRHRVVVPVKRKERAVTPVRQPKVITPVKRQPTTPVVSVKPSTSVPKAADPFKVLQ